MRGGEEAALRHLRLGGCLHHMAPAQGFDNGPQVLVIFRKQRVISLNTGSGGQGAELLFGADAAGGDPLPECVNPILRVFLQHIPPDPSYGVSHMVPDCNACAPIADA